MKMHSDFECAIRALRQEKPSLPGSILAINMDACAAALCRCDAAGVYVVKGGVQLNAENQSPVSLYENALSRLPGAAALKEDELARAWRRYIQSGKKSDEMPGGVSCAALESAFVPAAQLYEELFAQADNLLQDGDEPGVLLFGSMAARSLAVHAARDHFSFDPFLPDPLFLSAADPASLVRAGRSLLEAEDREASFGHDVSLLLIDSEGGEKSVSLAKPEQNADQLKTPAFTPQFCCCAGESLCLIADGKRQWMKIPAALLPSGLSMLSAGLTAAEEGITLHLRSESAEEHMRVSLN